MSWDSLLGPMQRLPQPEALGEWFGAVLSCGRSEPFELAVRGGRLAATPGLAFLAGYQAALRQLVPSAPVGIGALCATEQRRLRPADMQTRLDALTLTGGKDFVIAGSAAAWLLIPARDEAPGEAPRLSLCIVECDARGVTVENMPALPLVPDIVHGRLRLERAPCQRLAGDGWHDYVKPFRTCEDLYVLVALVSWLYGVASECAWPQALQLRLIGLLAGAAEISRLPATEVSTHLLLAALDAQWTATAPALDASLNDGPAHWAELWQRDRSILQLARQAQTKRLDKAAAAFALTPRAMR